MFSLSACPRGSREHTMFSQYLAALEDDLVLPQAFLLKCGLVPFHAQSPCLKLLFTG